MSTFDGPRPPTRLEGSNMRGKNGLRSREFLHQSLRILLLIVLLGALLLGVTALSRGAASDDATALPGTEAVQGEEDPQPADLPAVSPPEEPDPAVSGDAESAPADSDAGA
jgi:hypothetical protein